jgi:hypothetical protein
MVTFDFRVNSCAAVSANILAIRSSAFYDFHHTKSFVIERELNISIEHVLNISGFSSSYLILDG